MEALSTVELPPRAVVVVNDPARATDSATALRALARCMVVEAVVVATGSHRFDEDTRAAHERPLRAVLGPSIPIRWHDARSHDLVGIGGGVRVDPLVAAAPALVGVGSVEPHWFAGLTGAHKTLTIGVLDRASIERDHERVLLPGGGPLRLAGNPVHEAHRRLLRLVAGDRRVVALQHVGEHWDAGEPLESLERLRPWAEAAFLRTVERRQDWVWSRVAPPLSRSLYQADKGIKNVESVVRDGGAVVLEAACEDGVGPDRFVRLLERAPTARAARELVERQGYRLGDHKAVRWRELAARGVRLGLLGTDFDDRLLATLGAVRLIDDDAARRWLTATLGPDARGSVVEDAGNTVLEVR